MSRTTIRAAVRTPEVYPAHVLRIGLGIAAVASLLAFVAQAGAQQTTPPISIRPVVGALVGTGDQRDALKDAVLVGGQLSYAFHPNFAVIGSFGWSPSRDKLSLDQPKLDLYQYDLGIEGRLNNLTAGSPVAIRPFAALGAGARTYNLRDVPDASAQTNALGYGAVGLDIDQPSGKIGLRIEGRDNVTGFKGFRGELADRQTRNDVQFTAGLSYRF